MAKLSERIQEILDAGYAQIDLARAAKVTKGTSNQWLTGQIKSIKLEYAQGIEVLTGYCAEWIVTGNGPKKLKGQEGDDSAPIPGPALGIVESDPYAVDGDELLELFTLYKSATPEGRSMIMSMAHDATKLPPRLRRAANFGDDKK